MCYGFLSGTICCSPEYPPQQCKQTSSLPGKQNVNAFGPGSSQGDQYLFKSWLLLGGHYSQSVPGWWYSPLGSIWPPRRMNHQTQWLYPHPAFWCSSTPWQWNGLYVKREIKRGKPLRRQNTGRNGVRLITILLRHDCSWMQPLQSPSKYL